MNRPDYSYFKIYKKGNKIDFNDESIYNQNLNSSNNVVEITWQF